MPSRGRGRSRPTKRPAAHRTATTHPSPGQRTAHRPPRLLSFLRASPSSRSTVTPTCRNYATPNSGRRLHRPCNPRARPRDADVTGRATASVRHRTAASHGNPTAGPRRLGRALARSLPPQPRRRAGYAYATNAGVSVELIGAPGPVPLRKSREVRNAGLRLPFAVDAEATGAFRPQLLLVPSRGGSSRSPAARRAKP